MGDLYTLEESTGEDYTLIPEDTILGVKVTKVETVTTKMTDEITGEPVKQVEFTFVVTDDGDYQSRKVWGKTSTKFTTHEKCRLRAWTQEILAVDELPPGFKLDTDGLVGNSCRVVVGVNTWEDKKAGPDPLTGAAQYKSNNKVKDVIRARGGRPPEEPF